jgi:hypothetical protein
MTVSLAKTWFGKGGYIPSIMGGLLRSGPYFMTAAMAQGGRLVRNNKTRMASRKSRRGHTRRAKRSHK